MEKYFKTAFGVVILATLGLVVSCDTEKETCTGCCDEPGVTKVITLPKTGGQATLQFYNVITPPNGEYCEYYLATSKKVEGSCRPNFDSIYNSDIDYNNVFAIGGYDPVLFKQNGLRTFLRIQTDTDTSAIWPTKPYTDNYGANGKIFRGETEIIPISDDRGRINYYASGRYKYKFLIYDSIAKITDSTLVHTENFFKGMSKADSLLLIEEDFDLYLMYLEAYNASAKYIYDEGAKKEVLVDSVVGTFCIIRNDYECQIQSCVGKDAGDPLLK
jgi:hypothetical protein